MKGGDSMRNKYDIKRMQRWIRRNEVTFNGKYPRTEAEEVILNNFGIMRIRDDYYSSGYVYASYEDIRNMFLLKGGD